MLVADERPQRELLVGIKEMEPGQAEYIRDRALWDRW